MTETAVKEKEIAKAKENKMGVMPVGRLVISMSLPMMASMLVQALYNIVDSLFVSHVNSNAFTAVSLAFPMQNLMIAVGIGTAVGVNANIARSLGEKNFEKANSFARNGIFLAICSYVLFLLFAIFGTEIYFSVQTDVTATIEYGKQYLFIVTAASFGIFLQTVSERILQSTGKTVLSMFSQGLGALINIILDPLLIFGIGPFPQMGVAGAALATVIGQCAAAALAIWLNVTKNREINIGMKGFRPDSSAIKSIYRIGVPSIIMTSVTSVMTFLLNLILATFGALTDVLQSVLGAYFKLQSFIFMPVFGLNNGTVPIISYNYGAGKRSRLIKTIKLSVVFATAIMLIGLLLMQTVPDSMLKIFKASGDMLKYGVPALRIISISYILAATNIVFSSAYQSLGHSMNSMLISIARQLAVLVPVAYMLSKTGNPSAVWWAFPIAEVVAIIINCLFMTRIYRTVIKPMSDKV